MLLDNADELAAELLRTTTLPYWKIAERTGLSTSRVSKIRRTLGLRTLSDEDIALNAELEANKLAAVELIRAGYGYKAAASKCGISPALLRSFCKRNNIIRGGDGVEIYIYCLRCPYSRQAFYVGMARDPWRRFYQHLHNPYSRPMARWIESLKLLKKYPLLSILANVITTEPAKMEHEWIAKLADAGHPLMNLTGDVNT